MPGQERLEWTAYRRRLRDQLLVQHLRDRLHEYQSSLLASDAPETWTTRQVVFLESRSAWSTEAHRHYRERLRPEDHTEIAELRVDADGGVTDWNRALADLTGVPRVEAVGRPYADLIAGLELTNGYRDAAVAYVLGVHGGRGEPSASASASNSIFRPHPTESERRAGRSFPLPLPARRGSISARVEEDAEGCYVELLVTIESHLLDKVHGSRSGQDIGTRSHPGWIGGNEFVLRRRTEVRTLEELCRRRVKELAAEGNPHVSGTVVESPAEEAAYMAPTDKGTALAGPRGADAHTVAGMEPFFPSGGGAPSPVALVYARELLDIVRQVAREPVIKSNKGYFFSRDWRDVEETEEIHRHAFRCLRGESTIRESSSKSRLCWKIVKPSYGVDIRRLWSSFAMLQGRCVGRHCPIPNSRGTPVVASSLESPETKAFTLKIKLLENDWWEPGEREPYVEWANVQIPATLNFFQLQQVIRCVMCGHHFRNHRWIIAEQDVRRGTTLELDRDEDYDNEYHEDNTNRHLFSEGKALRQRVALSGAHIDHVGVLCHESDLNQITWRMREAGDLSCSDYYYSVCAALFRPGMSMKLLNGGGKFGEEYQITLDKIDTVQPTPNKCPSRNAFLAKCLKAKGIRDPKEAIKEANKQMQEDYERKCLRQDFSKEESLSFPWCRILTDRENNTRSVSRAFETVGLDAQPVAIWGEPPLPSDAEGFKSYMAMAVPEDQIDDCFRYRTRDEWYGGGGSWDWKDLVAEKVCESGDDDDALNAASRLKNGQKKRKKKIQKAPKTTERPIKPKKKK